MLTDFMLWWKHHKLYLYLPQWNLLFGFLQDDKEILSNDYTEIFQSSARCSLTLLNTQIEDYGTYTCMASNSAGQASCLAKLSVDTGELESFIITFCFIFTNPKCLLPRNSV